MIENEYKVMLTKEQYEKILALYAWDEAFSQTNHYYDTPELLLSERHITCRVREKDGGFYLQVKLPTESELSRIELEERLSSLPEKISAERLCALAGVELPNVARLGALTTHRSVKLFDGAEIDLDRSSYFGKEDYELEIEFTDEPAAKRLLEEIRAAVPFENSPITGKIRRFLAEYINGR